MCSSVTLSKTKRYTGCPVSRVWLSSSDIKSIDRYISIFVGIKRYRYHRDDETIVKVIQGDPIKTPPKMHNFRKKFVNRTKGTEWSIYWLTNIYRCSNCPPRAAIHARACLTQLFDSLCNIEAGILFISRVILFFKSSRVCGSEV